MKFHTGDSMIEILMAFAVFSVAAVSAIGSMSFSLLEAQSNLEISMARNELDAQAEALRFIQDAYSSSLSRDSNTSNYSTIWNEIKRLSNKNIDSSDGKPLEPTISTTVCADAYDTGEGKEGIIERYHAFAINPRRLADSVDSKRALIYTAADSDGKGDEDNIYNSLDQPLMTPASTYPRFVYERRNDATLSVETDEGSVQSVSDDFLNYRDVFSAEGLWIYGIPSATLNDSFEPEFYDFYISSCWYPQGRERANSVNTAIRLYNPTYAQIEVTEKPAYFVTFYYRQKIDDKIVWSHRQMLERATVSSTGSVILNVIESPDDVYTDPGTIIAGWKYLGVGDILSDDEAERISGDFKTTDYINYNGEYCSEKEKESTDTYFRPDCDYTSFNLRPEELGMSNNINVLVVEKPPLDVVMIVDMSDSMKQELNAFKNGVRTLSKEIFDDTEGTVALYGIDVNSHTRDSGLRDAKGKVIKGAPINLCPVGYHEQIGTCGQLIKGVRGEASSEYEIFQTVNDISTSNTGNPENYMYQFAHMKIDELIANPRASSNKMIIILTDTCPARTTHSGVKNYASAYGIANDYDDVRNNLAEYAKDKKVRIYIIASTQAFTIYGNEYVNTGGYTECGKKSYTDWEPIINDSNGAFIHATQALGAYDSKKKTFSGLTEFSFTADGRLRIKDTTTGETKIYGKPW